MVCLSHPLHRNQKKLEFIQICIVMKQKERLIEMYKSIQHKFHSSKNKFVIIAVISKGGLHKAWPNTIQQFFVIINMIVVSFLIISGS